MAAPKTTTAKAKQAATPAQASAPKAEQDANAKSAQSTPSATSAKQAPATELPGVFIRTKRRVKSRRRAGFRFNREGVGISLELLSEQQLKQLREDPALEVTDCTFPVDDANTTPEA
ncbi:hypothetical protein SAMN04487958_1034 [Vreelandella subterranea]|uniref:Mu-like prophage FluMu N-terminal domain-containing protein n=1 Tax=Vreelandella subterranea TaxID=416874 RepID=A0A1H9S0Z0_9GAMM|nr:HI1506-related protein [Halomonas subterranea]SER78700.1 hypothetical protein SAMN04487958_1034 [Halomonas subterranea]